MYNAFKFCIPCIISKVLGSKAVADSPAGPAMAGPLTSRPDIVLCGIYSNITVSYCFLREAESSESIVRTSSLLTSFKTVEPGHTFRENIAFTGHTILGLTMVGLVTWLYILLTYAGDIHPNPGPLSTTSSNSDSIST